MTQLSDLYGGAAHDEIHSLESHSDTTVSGAELDSLTDNSIANALHRHSELVASDGSPDPALRIDAGGNALISAGSITVPPGYDYSWGDTNNRVNYNATAVRIIQGAVITLTCDGGEVAIPNGKITLANGTGINEFSTDGTLAGDSDDAVPTEKAVKTYVENFTSEINPTNLITNSDFENWPDGTSSPPAPWEFSTVQGTAQVLIGTYSASITRAGTNMSCYQYIHTDKGIDYWKGRTISYSCYVWCATASIARIVLYDSITSFVSSYHTGDSTWQLLTITGIVGGAAAHIRVYLQVNTSNGTAYFDGAMAVEGPNIFAYAPKPLSIDNVTGAAEENILINQDFSIWQDEETYTNPASGVYTADGYYAIKTDGGGTAPSVNVKKNATDMEVGFGQCCELEITNVGAPDAARNYGIQQTIEDYKKYRGKTITLSMRVKASTLITMLGVLQITDGVDSNSAFFNSVGTDWVTHSTTLTVDDAATTLHLIYYVVAGAGTIDTTGSIYIQWMKLELGSVNTPLIPRSNAEEYLLCGTTIAPLNRTNPSFRFEDDAGNLGIEIVDGGSVSLTNGTGINEFSTDGTLAGDSDDAVPTEKAVATAINTKSDNILINQDFSIWQENTTFTNPGNDVYTADGYYVHKDDGTGTAPSINVKKNTSDMEIGFEQCCELEITNVGSFSGGTNWRIEQDVEDYVKYRGKTITLSFRVKASVAITLGVNSYLWIYAGTNYETAIITSITTNWVTYSVTVTVSDAATYIMSMFDINTSISTTGSIYIQWMKLELGSVVTPLIPRNTGEELALCQRYYQKSYAQGVFAGATTDVGLEIMYIQSVANSQVRFIKKNVKFPVLMKAAPTVTLYDAVGSSGDVSMGTGHGLSGTVENTNDEGFICSGVDGSSLIIAIYFHYIAISRP